MARYKPIDRNPRLLPVVLSEQIQPGTFEFALDHLVDNELDLSALDGELWQFVGHANGGRELVVYFVGPHTVNYFVAQVSSGSDVEEVQRVLRNLASSYREGTDCKPCGESDACKTGS